MTFIEKLRVALQQALPDTPATVEKPHYELHINDRLRRVNQTIAFESFRELNDYVWEKGLMLETSKQVLAIQRNKSARKTDYVISLNRITHDNNP